MERGLIDEYQQMIDQAISALSRDSYDRAVAIAELPDMIRGYEEIKEANVEKFREAAKDLLG